MSKKYYFASEDEELCYHLQFHLDQAKENGLNKVELIEAVKVSSDGSGFFWCKAVDEVCETGCCGKQCEDYTPKNGKSGMCKYKFNGFYEHGEQVVFKVETE